MGASYRRDYEDSGVHTRAASAKIRARDGNLPPSTLPILLSVCEQPFRQEIHESGSPARKFTTTTAPPATTTCLATSILDNGGSRVLRCDRGRKAGFQ